MKSLFDLDKKERRPNAFLYHIDSAGYFPPVPVGDLSVEHQIILVPSPIKEYLDKEKS